MPSKNAYENTRKKERAKQEREKNAELERVRILKKRWQYEEATKEEIILEKEFTNPEKKTYVRYLATWKLYCKITGCREDPEWYRLVRKANTSINDLENEPVRFDLSGETYCLRRRKRKIFRTNNKNRLKQS